MAGKKKGLLDTGKDLLKGKAAANKAAKEAAKKTTAKTAPKATAPKKTAVTGGTVQAAKTITSKTSKTRNKTAPKTTKAKTGVKATGGTAQYAKTILSPKTQARNLQGTKALPVKKTGAKTGAAFLAGVGVGAVGTKKIGAGKKSSDSMSFDQAFKAARKEMGTDKVFTWRGKKYSTVTMAEVKKAGFKTLAEYNANKRSKGKSTNKPSTKTTTTSTKSNTSTRKKPGMDYDPIKLKGGGLAGGGRQSRQNRQK